MGGASMKLTGKRCRVNTSELSCSFNTRVGHTTNMGRRSEAESNTQRLRFKKPEVAASSISETEVGTSTMSNSNINSPAKESDQVRSHTKISHSLAARRICKRASKIGRLPPWSTGKAKCLMTAPTSGACLSQLLDEPWGSQSIRVTPKFILRLR